VVISVHIAGLQGENQSLRAELRGVIEQHQQEVESTSQLQELAAMLQESHRYKKYVCILSFNIEGTSILW